LQGPSALRSSRLNNYNDTPEISCGLVTEADVVHLPGRHLVDPVMVALEVAQAGLLKEYAEYGVKKLRVDVALRSTITNQAAVLIEYKRCGYINNVEFATAMIESKKLQFELEVREKTRLSTLRDGSNAYKFVCQGTAYHERTNCNYVALCDYEHLVLIRYRGLDWAEATIVPRHLFRKALLGFCLEASNDTRLTKT
jgi:hypothetical protein